jgi:DNA-binding MarR family transcriptional regulator
MAPAVQATRALARLSRMLERSSGELNLSHYRVLSAIAAGDQRASRVAERLAIGRPAISSAVEALCARGLVARAVVADDQRAAVLTVTAQGRQVLARAEGEMSARVATLCARTPNAAQVMESLQWLATALDDVMAERVAAARAERGAP